MISLNKDTWQSNHSPLVCICIPTYNAASTIKETLASILAQTYTNLVVHISDNASTDDTLKIVESFTDPRISVHCHSVNVGGEGNFNRCIQLAEGKYTAIFHSDDIYEPEMVVRQVGCLEQYLNVGCVFTAAKTIDARGVVTGLIGQSFIEKADVECYNFSMFIKSILKRGNFVVCPSCMMRTEILKNEIRQWRGDLFRSSADLDVWLRVLATHEIGFLGQPLMKYRIDSNQFSSSVRLRTTRADFFLVMDHYLKLQDVQKFLSKEDRRNYLLLVDNDLVWRAINQFSKGNISEAKRLLYEIFSADNVVASLASRRDILTLLVSLSLYLTIVFRLERFGLVAISYFRKKFNR